jgi:uncharacterized membrane protein
MNDQSMKILAHRRIMQRIFIRSVVVTFMSTSRPSSYAAD